MQQIEILTMCNVTKLNLDHEIWNGCVQINTLQNMLQHNLYMAEIRSPSESESESESDMHKSLIKLTAYMYHILPQTTD